MYLYKNITVKISHNISYIVHKVLKWFIYESNELMLNIIIIKGLMTVLLNKIYKITYKMKIYDIAYK